MKINFYFKTDKSLKFAEIDKTGEPCEAYLKVSLDDEKALSKSDMLEATEGVRRMIASQMGIDINLLYPITEEEYLSENNEEI